MRIGSLCSGYEGIGLGIDGDVVFVCDPEPAAATVLAAHHPDAPNLHDLKALAWAEYDVDLLTAGYPCQPFSGAGKRKGTDDPRHLWPYISQGIALSRPPRVLLENVRGHLSLGWDTVLIDLHRLRYDVRWTLLRAADVGAPHGRARMFALAVDRAAGGWDASTRPAWAGIWGDQLVHPEPGLFGDEPLPIAGNRHVPMLSAGLMVGGVVWEQEALVGTPIDGLLPTPAVNDMGKAYSPAEWDAWCDMQRAKHGNGNGHGPSLEVEAARMADGNRWGRYAAAVARCEALTRPAPDPTLPSGRNGAHRLSPRFVEFMMMLPDGWVTGHGLKRDQQLKLLGNGCVPAQVAAAYRHLTTGLTMTAQAAA